jgi:hypothetical protein
MPDYRTMLKDCLRGQIWDRTIPSLPISRAANGEVLDPGPEYMRAYFELLREVYDEESEDRAWVLSEAFEHERELTSA